MDTTAQGWLLSRFITLGVAARSPSPPLWSQPSGRYLATPHLSFSSGQRQPFD
jgi:hypothetical protein